MARKPMTLVVCVVSLFVLLALSPALLAAGLMNRAMLGLGQPLVEPARRAQALVDSPMTRWTLLRAYLGAGDGNAAHALLAKSGDAIGPMPQAMRETLALAYLEQGNPTQAEALEPQHLYLFYRLWQRKPSDAHRDRILYPPPSSLAVDTPVLESYLQRAVDALVRDNLWTSTQRARVLDYVAWRRRTPVVVPFLAQEPPAPSLLPALGQSTLSAEIPAGAPAWDWNVYAGAGSVFYAGPDSLEAGSVRIGNLWERVRSAAQQPAYGEFLSPEVGTESSVRYALAFDYKTDAAGDAHAAAFVQEYAGLPNCTLINAHLPDTSGAWQHWSQEFTGCATPVPVRVFLRMLGVGSVYYRDVTLEVLQ